MPNARPAFMEKVTLTGGGTDTWRFYPRHSVNTWEVTVDVNSTTPALEFQGVLSTWSGEDWNISSGTKTVISKNVPGANQLTLIGGASGGDKISTDTNFAIDNSYKGLQVTVTAGAGHSAIVHVVAYDKNNGSADGSGYLTGTAQTS